MIFLCCDLSDLVYSKMMPCGVFGAEWARVTHDAPPRRPSPASSHNKQTKQNKQTNTKQERQAQEGH